MFGIKRIQATFVGTKEDWQEVIGCLAVGYGPDRRIATAILNGIERRRISEPEYAYHLRFHGGTVDRLREIYKELSNA